MLGKNKFFLNIFGTEVFGTEVAGNTKRPLLTFDPFFLLSRGTSPPWNPCYGAYGAFEQSW